MNAHDFNDRPRDEHEAFATADDTFLAMLRLQDDADALTGEAGRAIDARLLSDATLRDEAQSLADLDAMLRGVASRTNATISPAASDRALQASLRLMREQSLLRRQSGKGARRRRIGGVPKWAWGAAVAAAVAVGFVVWTADSDPTTKIGGSGVPSQLADATPDWSPPPFGEIRVAGDPQPNNNAEIQQQIDALGYMSSQMNDTN